MIENQVGVNTQIIKSKGLGAAVSSPGWATQNSNQARQSLIEFRCPQCFKLYTTESADIYSSQPQFECISCHAQFTLDYPVRNPKAAYTRALSLPQVGKLAQRTAQAVGQNKKAERTADRQNDRQTDKQAELQACPKCETLNPRGAFECYKCGVIIAKARMEKAGAGLPSLLKLWHDLMQDYGNMARHMAFVDRCEDLQALPFAMKKYQELKEAQPQDGLATQMLNSVLLKSISKTGTRMSQSGFGKFVLASIRNQPWGNIFRSSPVFISVLMILMGVLKLGSRNLIGGGVALLALTFGVAYFLKGRITPSVFWRKNS